MPLASRRSRLATLSRAAAAALALATAACGDDDTIAPTPPALTTLTLSAPQPGIERGQTVQATVAGADQNGAAFPPGPITWATAAPTVAVVSASGVITGVGPGTAQIVATAGGVAGQLTVTVTAPPRIVVNEVESNLGTPGDWVELHNPGTAAVDVSGWRFTDNDTTRAFRIAAGTTIPAGGYLVLDESQFGFGLGAPDAARLLSRFDVVVDSHDWTSHATTTYGRCADATGPFTTTFAPTRGAANDCRAPLPSVRINEIESNQGTPGDWIELVNTGTTPVDVSNFVVKDDDDARTTRLPAGSVIAPGGFLVVEETTLGFGLGAPDAARLFLADGTTLVDGHAWTTHAATTLGRCPDPAGAFAVTTQPTRGAANACGIPLPGLSPWLGGNAVSVAGAGGGVFAGNMSGLAWEGATGGAPAVLWAARNGPGAIFRLVERGGAWVSDTAGGWGAGKLLRYPGGTGDVDAEGVAFAGASAVSGPAAGGLYVAAERNNAANAVSRNTVLRFDPGASGATLTATHEWNLTADLPTTNPNLGLEAITWIPDSALVAQGFLDESRGRAYAPADYPNHGTGLFFVGLEANGVVYAYALDHATSGFTRVATIQTGFSGVMGLEYDPATRQLWAMCDNTCDGSLAVLRVDGSGDAAARGRFRPTNRFARPTGMPNLNNEGFAFVGDAACAGGFKTAFWADDSETEGHALRRATMPCGPFASGSASSRSGRP